MNQRNPKDRTQDQGMNQRNSRIIPIMIKEQTKETQGSNSSSRNEPKKSKDRSHQDPSEHRGQYHILLRFPYDVKLEKYFPIADLNVQNV